MEWTHALSGNIAISKVLDRLIKLTNADAALIIRTSKTDRRIKYIERCCIHEGKVWPSQPQSQAEFVLGDFISTAKAGSIWKSSEVLTSDKTQLSPLGDRNPDGLFEVFIVPLETTGGHFDHLELHYRHSPKRQDLDLLTLMAPTLAFGWSKRTPGTISAASKRVRGSLLREVQGDRFVPILDPQNPAGLSRCEFRVCAMLKEGMTVKKISGTLSVNPTTIRSHLSSIFSKTGASNQVELVHLLNRKIDFESSTTRLGQVRRG